MDILFRPRQAFIFTGMEKKADSPFPSILLSEEKPVIRITDPRTCYYCGSAPLHPDKTLCPVCRFPQNGLPAEQEAFIDNAREKAGRHGTLEEIIGRAQTLLMFAGFSVIIVAAVGLFFDMQSPKFRDVFFSHFVYIGSAALPNLVLWFWSRKMPFEAILSATVLTSIGAGLQFTLGQFSMTGLIIYAFEMLIFIHALISYKEALEIEQELVFKAEKLDERVI